MFSLAGRASAGGHVFSPCCLHERCIFPKVSKKGRYVQGRVVRVFTVADFGCRHRLAPTQILGKQQCEWHIYTCVTRAID